MGEDLLEQSVNNNRISEQGKKWWWPLGTHRFKVAVINTWRLYWFVGNKLICSILSEVFTDTICECMIKLAFQTFSDSARVYCGRCGWTLSTENQQTTALPSIPPACRLDLLQMPSDVVLGEILFHKVFNWLNHYVIFLVFCK